jgi:NMD protein affecting ribosome stability and mRNA decay
VNSSSSHRIGGTQIAPNEAAMCMDCLRMEVDVTLGIARKGDLIQCGKCDQWCTRKDTWAPHGMY